MIKYRVNNEAVDTITIDGIKSYTFKPLKRNLQKNEYFIYTIKSKDRIDVLSQRFYGNPLLWILIAQVNPNIDPLELIVEDKIKILYSEYVKDYL